MKDPNSLHARLQEYTDCFSEADAREELEKISRRGIAGDSMADLTELALRYLACALLHGIEEQAETIRISREGDLEGTCRMVGVEETLLPRPPAGLSREMVGIVRCITDLDDDIAVSKLACGIRKDRLDIDVSIHRSGQKEVLSLHLQKAR